jgi:proline iminopeptidase
MPLVKGNGIDIEVEEFGRKSDPAVLLIMGLAAQLTHWPTAFIDGLVDAGYRVIRFDNRDIGLSEKLHAKRALKPVTYMLAARLFGIRSLAPYTLHDMAADAAGVLDALEVDSAHIVGVSMGGMIGQLFTARYPDRAKSFTAIMSSTNNPKLRQADPAIIREIFAARTRPHTRDEIIDRVVHIWGVIGTPDGGNDPKEFRERIAATVDRCNYPAGVRRQIAAIISTGDLRRWTKKITAPSLVIHGTLDPLAPMHGGLDIAATIAHARMELIDGMGHDLPPKFLQRITDLIVAHLRAAEDSRAERAA